MHLDRSIPGLKRFGDIACYITHLENHYKSTNTLMGFIDLRCRETFLIFRALNILMPGTQPQRFWCNWSVCVSGYQELKKFLQVILMCRQSWEPLASVLNQWFSVWSQKQHHGYHLELVKNANYRILPDLLNQKFWGWGPAVLSSRRFYAPQA